MPHRFILAASVLVATFGLAGCNASQRTTASLQASAVSEGVPPDFRLPPGAGCTAAIDRYAKVVYSDEQTGMVSDSVFGDIRVEIDHAADTCRAGRDADARAEIVASQHKHGYPASS
jgi:hypothetical protein